ncbi:MAG TPA: hypothetical protein VIF14_18215 [Alphaproteobacteria bacterium]|jgi:phosphatidylethanolamine-binding protein (PEBP) family uncharacterized protein
MRFAAIAIALLAAACATEQRAPPGAPELGVEFSWTGVQPCSNVSPRIVVRDFPAATRRFRVELVDTDAAISRHGGGEVEAAQDGVIAAGALKSYRGPCPSQSSIVYEMRVAALDAGGRVIARGAERQTYALTPLRRPSRR